MPNAAEDPGGRLRQRRHSRSPKPQAKGGVTRTSSIQNFESVDALVDVMRPEVPVHCTRPHVIAHATQWFLNHFPGTVMYSVKSNPDPIVLKTLWKSGLRRYDVASLPEVELVSNLLPKAEMFFMHPVKSREAIWKAYHQYGIRDFSLDSFEELDKILSITNNADDLNLYVRLAIGNQHAAYSLAGKFGIPATEAASLLLATRTVSRKLGICFHIGSQCMNPASYESALAHVGMLLETTRVKVDAIDVGGGFPSIYPGLVPPALITYMDAIRSGLKSLNLPEDCEIMCEPGRALVAESGSLVVRVELRKGNMLYLNDGVYGSLFDAGTPEFQFPVRALRPHPRRGMEELMPMAEGTMEFGFFGPTCDSIDVMKGPFVLPDDITDGDWIEVGSLGAYGASFRTNFNGFYEHKNVVVEDMPQLSLFRK